MEKEIILNIVNINKSFPGVKALNSVNISINKGEVRAIVGENGAGKSTLIKIVAGVLEKDSGQIIIEGKEVNYSNPKEALMAGISVIYQELDLIPDLDGLTNIFLGFEKLRSFNGINAFLDRKKMEEIAKDTFNKLQIKIDLHVPIKTLPIAEQQIIAICKAVIHNARILIMDEPSASLSGEELEHLYKLIKNLKEQGVTIIYISHRLEEIFKIADNVTVLRDGNVIGTKPVKELNKEILVQMMVGKDIVEKRINNRDSSEFKETILEVKNLNCQNRITDLSFEVKKGEIFGILGLVGSGRNELAKILYGMLSKDSGEIFVNHKLTDLSNPLKAINNSISYVPDDRQRHGMFLQLNVMLNVIISVLYKFINKLGILKFKTVENLFEFYRQKINIKVSSRIQLAKELSGGNQQKLILSRCLARGNEIILLNEPTRGIDVGAKFEIYQILWKIALEGKTIIIFSSEIPELANLCDRIAVLKRGFLQRIFESKEMNQERILAELLG